jgi:hypothetical protein
VGCCCSQAVKLQAQHSTAGPARPDDSSAQHSTEQPSANTTFANVLLKRYATDSQHEPHKKPTLSTTSLLP